MGSSRRNRLHRHPRGSGSTSSQTVMPWIVRACGRRLWMVAGLVALHMITAANAVLFALMMRDAIDAATAANRSGFIRAASVFGAALLVQVLLTAAGRWLREATLESLDNALRRRTFADLLAGDVAVVQRQHTGELMNRLTSDVAVVSGAVAGLPSAIASSAVRIAGVLAVMTVLDIRLAAVFALAGCCMGIASLPLRSRLKRLHRDVQEAEGRVRSLMQEVLSNLLVVRVFGARCRMTALQQQGLEEHRTARMRRTAVSNLSTSGLQLAMQAGFFLGFVWCCNGLLHGTVTYGTLMAVVQLVGQLQQPFASLGGIFPRYTAMVTSAERLAALTPQAPCRLEINHDEIARLAPRLKAITCDDVRFSYGRGAVLHGLTVHIPRGAFVAVTGHSGVGKSTLLTLLLGVRQPNAGTIALRFTPEPGVHSSDDTVLTPAQLPPGMVAYVPQGNALMSGTVREAVAFAENRDAIDNTRVRWACRTADAAAFVTALPDGYDTQLGEHGAGLSEGQLQRLSVARALYSGAPVLLLDEATSALDAASERRMLQSIRALGDRTVLMVTHRPEVLEYCDQVIELDDADDE